MKRSECTDPFLRGYIDAALFTTDENPPGGMDYVESGRADDMWPAVPQSFIDEAKRDCAAFEAANETWLAQAGDFEQNGSDLWYTRNRHGVGFWDRDYDGNVATGLTKAAHAMGEHYLDLEPLEN